MNEFVSHAVKVMKLNFKTMIKFRSFIIKTYYLDRKKHLVNKTSSERQLILIENLEKAFKKFNTKLEVLNETGQKLKDSKKYFFLVNHNNPLDPIFTLVASKYLNNSYIHVANREMKKTPFLKNLASATSTLFIDRENKRQAVLDSRKIINAAQENSILIFPQGDVGREKIARKGAIQIVKKSKLPVVFMEIQNTTNMLKSNYLDLKDRTVKIIIKKIISVNELEKLDTNKLIEAFSKAVNINQVS